MSIRRKLAATSTINLIDYGLRFAAILIASPFLIETLGKDQYGLWIVLLSVIGYVNLLDLGFSNTAVRYLSQALGAGNDDLFFAYFRFFHRIYTWICGGALLLTTAAVALVPLFTDQPGLIAQSRFVLAIGGGLTALSFLLKVYGTLLKSHVLYHRLVIAGLARMVIFTASLFIFLPKNPGVTTLVILWTSTAALEQVLIYIQAKRYIPSIRPNGNLGSGKAGEITAFAGKHFTSVAAGFLRERLDTQVLGGLVSTIAVTNYSVGSRFLMMFVDIVNAVFGGHFLAAFARHSGDGHDSDEDSKQSLLRTLRISGPLAWTAGTCVLVLAPPFIDRWLGPGFEQSHLVIYMLAVPYTLTLMQYPVGSWLGSRNRHGRLALIAIIGGILNAIASIVLVLKIGFAGVIVATAIELTVTAVIVWPWMLKRFSGISLSSYTATLLRPLLTLAPASFAAAALVYYARPLTWISIIGQSCAIAILFVAVIWFTVFTSDERKTARALLPFLRA